MKFELTYKGIAALVFVLAAHIANCRTPPGRIRIRAPLYVNSRQLRKISKVCSDCLEFTDRDVMKIYANTPEGLVLWLVSSGTGLLHTLPGWLNQDGQYWEPKMLSGYSLNLVIWKRTCPEYETVWLSNKQAEFLEGAATQLSKKVKAQCGVMILRRTDQGLIVKLRSEGGRAFNGQIMCVSDSGRPESPDLALPKTHLMWFETLKKDEAMAAKHRGRNP